VGNEGVTLAKAVSVHLAPDADDPALAGVAILPDIVVVIASVWSGHQNLDILPISSAAVCPNSFSVAGLMLSMMPSASTR
jgi:hypothetical protein